MAKAQNQEMRKSLNSTILIMQCIGIFAVVLGHADIGSANIPSLIKLAFPYYSWHMPFFVFLSGYLFNRKRPMLPYILGKCRTLLIPGLVVNAICGIFSMIIQRLDLADYGREITLRRLFITPFTTGYQFYINVSLWFIFALFTLEIFSCLIDRLAKGKLDIAYTLITMVISVLCCICCFYYHKATRNQYLNAGLRFGFLLFFFWCGVLYRSHLEKYLKRFFNLKTAMFLFCSMCLFYGITGFDTTFNTRNMDFSSLSVPNGFWIPIIIPLVAIVFFLSISYSLSPHVEKCQALYWLGTNTRYVVYWHQLCFILFSFLLHALLRLGIVPDIKGFSSNTLYSGQYYVSSNSCIAIVNVIFSTFMPIIICTSLKKLRQKWIALLLGSGIVLLISGYLYWIHIVIH